MKRKQCGFFSLPTISEGNVSMPPLALLKKLKLIVRRNVSAGTYRALLRYYENVLCLYIRLKNKGQTQNGVLENSGPKSLKTGDLVRIRSKEEIQATLNNVGRLKGCAFMSVQETYCGTVHTVLKSMERFVDERDLKVKRCTGLILLEGVICEGTTDFGRCDRSCFLFWREEWLDKIEE